MMTSDEKLDMLSILLDDSNVSDDKLEAYLSAAEKEILAWRYSYSSQQPSEVPAEYEMTQIHAVIAGLSISGAENQTQHSENGINRMFKYPDMVAYIRNNVLPIAGVF